MVIKNYLNQKEGDSMEGRIAMSKKDLFKLEILRKVELDILKQVDAAKELNLDVRQVRRLSLKLKELGPKGLISKKVGARSNNRINPEKEAQILAFCLKPEHRDFGPTLVFEYLLKQSSDKISLSTVRNVMAKNSLWAVKKIRELKIHPLRDRRPQKGDLIQLDGSEHDWFEGRGPRCSLLVFIDDATSETLLLKFVKSENLNDYFDATREYVEKIGRPKAFYTDKHAVFRVNRDGSLSGSGLTQFGRAMKELDIELICANSPQAKGRVERRNRDFQNRLVKAMRLSKISNIEEANAFIPSFLEDFNQQFAKKPKSPVDAHRPLSSSYNLDQIFCIKESRCLSKNLTLQYNNVIYQVIADKKEYTLRKAKVTIIENRQGDIVIEHKGKALKAVPFHKMEARTDVVSSKELLSRLVEFQTTKYKPKRSHPWKSNKRGFSAKSCETASSF